MYSKTFTGDVYEVVAILAPGDSSYTGPNSFTVGRILIAGSHEAYKDGGISDVEATHQVITNGNGGCVKCRGFDFRVELKGPHVRERDGTYRPAAFATATSPQLTLAAEAGGACAAQLVARTGSEKN